MALKYHPSIGQILMCDFNRGFVAPEMVKNRPIVVIATGNSYGSRLVTVVPLSTAAPDNKCDHHCIIDNKHLPNISQFKNKVNWLKGDMVYRVGWDRLNPVVLRKDRDGKRIYFTQRLSRENMKQVYECVLHGLNLGDLAQHL